MKITPSASSQFLHTSPPPSRTAPLHNSDYDTIETSDSWCLCDLINRWIVAPFMYLLSLVGLGSETAEPEEVPEVNQEPPAPVKEEEKNDVTTSEEPPAPVIEEKEEEIIPQKEPPIEVKSPPKSEVPPPQVTSPIVPPIQPSPRQEETPKVNKPLLLKLCREGNLDQLKKAFSVPQPFVANSLLFPTLEGGSGQIIPILNYLFKCGAYINYLDKDTRDTLLIRAIKEDMTQIAITLIDKNKNIDLRYHKLNNDQKPTAFYWAIEHCNDAVATKILSTGYKPLFDYYDRVVEKRMTETAKKLRPPVNIDPLEELRKCCKKRSKKFLNLVKQQILTAEQQEELLYVLFSNLTTNSTEKKALSIARELITSDTNKEILGNYLLTCAQLGFTNIAKLILDQDPDMNVKDDKARSPFYYALSTKNDELSYRIVDKMETIESRMHAVKGRTPLQHACFYGMVKTVAHLLKKVTADEKGFRKEHKENSAKYYASNPDANVSKETKNKILTLLAPHLISEK